MAGFDEDQPRDEKGQWTAGSGRSAILAAASDKKKIAMSNIQDYLTEGGVKDDFIQAGVRLNVAGDLLAHEMRSNIMLELDYKMNQEGLTLPQKMDVVEDLIRYQKFESMAAYNEDGTMEFFNDGVAGQVNIDDEQAERIKGGYMTHNHPRDHSFSNGDLNSTVQMGLKEMRAASKFHDYVYRPNYNYTYIGASNDPVFSNQLAMQDAIDDEVALTKKKLLSGEYDHEEAAHFFQHRIMQKFAKATGGNYSVETKDPRSIIGKPEYAPYEDIFGERALELERETNTEKRIDEINDTKRYMERQLKKHM